MKKRSGLYPRAGSTPPGPGWCRRPVAVHAGGDGRGSRPGPGVVARRWRRGASRWRCTTRPRSCSTWRSAWRWAGTAWPMSRCCAPSPACSGRWPRTRRCRARSTRWPPTRPGAGRDQHRPGARPARAVWELAGEHAPDADGERRRRRWSSTWTPPWSPRTRRRSTPRRRSSAGYGFHPLWAFVDHGPDGTGEPLAVLLRPGNAGSNTAADHIAVIRDALRQLPGHRPGTPAGAAGADPHRRRRLHPRGAGLAGRPAVVATRSGSPCPTHAAELLARIPRRRGRRPTTPTARSATAPGSPSSPGCWTCPAGRPGCG